MTTRVITSDPERDAEVWHKFPGYEDRYEIRMGGLVRGIDRYAIRRGAPPMFIRGRNLKTALVKGYRAIQPVVDGVKHTAYIHRAIAMLFVPNPDGKPHINHIDGCRTNNSAQNLEWCTHAENMRHAFETGLTPFPNSGPGTASPAAKLDDNIVRQIKNRIARGDRLVDIARDFGVVKGTVGHIKHGKTWAHIQAGASA